jgi:Amt family ammonium transporter
MINVTDMTATVEALVKNADILWTLMAGFLVFFMQAGFAMVETGFTRAKNAGNIIMKNTMDFCVGSVLYLLFGYGLMYGAKKWGLIGTTGFFDPTQIGEGYFIFFQTVFCATAATIVSGAMAERTKFVSYLLYSAVISLIIYPIVGAWTWGGGWLAEMGFHDFAGSTVVHSVGGWCALVGTMILGPRIGKFNKDRSPNAIPGHSITLGALGVFILWFGWFGFNPGSTVALVPEIGDIAMTTNLAAATGGLSAMFLSWIRFKKPDVGLTLNGVLGGLVAITAGCAVVSNTGALAIGIVAGIIVVYGVTILEKVFRIDDPVGAVPVHLMNGVFGTLAVGLFAIPDNFGGIPAGLFYGGDLSQLGIQAIGVAAVAAWTFACGYILFTVINKTVGLRVSEKEETAGLDIYEHGSESYPDFMLRG